MRRALVLVAALMAAGRAHGEELAAEQEVGTIKAAEALLGKVEKELRAQAGVDAAVVANVTLPLQDAVEEDLGKGAVKLYPRALFDACLQRLKKGLDRETIGKQLVELHRKGELAKAAAAASSDTVKKVASFVFDKERVRAPDPHLPSSFRAAPGEKVKGIYQICVGTDGKVTKITVVQSIAGADQSVMEQIQGTWVYKPQPVPVCTSRAFVFQFN
jgi:hypothetical protein